jgi:ribosomal protein S15P/S13E
MNTKTCSHGYHWLQIDECEKCQTNYQIFTLISRIENLEKEVQKLKNDRHSNN